MLPLTAFQIWVFVGSAWASFVLFEQIKDQSWFHECADEVGWSWTYVIALLASVILVVAWPISVYNMITDEFEL